MSEYQPRTPDRLMEILRAQDANPRSWQQEAADEIERLRDILRKCMPGANIIDLGNGEHICLYQQNRNET